MKNEKRIRAKSSAAKVQAQTKNQVEPGSKQSASELADAKRVVANFYYRQRVKPYGEAISELEAFGCAIQHHPELQTIIRALQEISFAENDLDVFRSESAAMAAAGIRSSLSEEEMAARHWFGELYKRVREKNFLNAQSEYGGFHPWIKGNDSFQEVDAALASFLSAATILEDFAESVSLNEGLEEEGGAR